MLWICDEYWDVCFLILDLQKVIYYFMDLGKNRGMTEQVQDEETEEIRILLENKKSNF